MPTVTDIKRQKRSDTRVSVYLDGAYAFALPDLDLSTSGLRVGQELTADEVLEFQQQAQVEGAYAKALRFLSVRMRSRREIQDYLARKGVEETQAAGVIERLERAGLLNDQEFAAAWIANRQALRPRSKRQLEQELLGKGMSRSDVAEAVQQLGGEDELESLIRLAAKKSRLPQYQDSQKLLGYLARQGYAYEQIKKALDTLGERSLD